MQERIAEQSQLDMPPAAAQRMLVSLSAMKPEGEQQLTPTGRAMAAFGSHPRRARELEAEGLTGIVADAAYLVALLEEDLRGSERLSVLFHHRQGALRQSAARWFERLGVLPCQCSGTAVTSSAAA